MERDLMLPLYLTPWQWVIAQLPWKQQHQNNYVKTLKKGQSRLCCDNKFAGVKCGIDIITQFISVANEKGWL